MPAASTPDLILPWRSRFCFAAIRTLQHRVRTIDDARARSATIDFGGTSHSTEWAATTGGSESWRAYAEREGQTARIEQRAAEILSKPPVCHTAPRFCLAGICVSCHTSLAYARIPPPARYRSHRVAFLQNASKVNNKLFLGTTQVSNIYATHIHYNLISGQEL